MPCLRPPTLLVGRLLLTVDGILITNMFKIVSLSSGKDHLPLHTVWLISFSSFIHSHSLDEVVLKLFEYKQSYQQTSFNPTPYTLRDGIEVLYQDKKKVVAAIVGDTIWWEFEFSICGEWYCSSWVIAVENEWEKSQSIAEYRRELPLLPSAIS